MNAPLPTLEEITRILPSYSTWPDLLTPVQTAEIAGVKVSSLGVSRCRGGGIPYVKIGGSVRYPKHLLADYVLKTLSGAN